MASVLCCCVALCANAFSTSKYASQSLLATGKWVKVAIPTNGVYEITAQELQEMGFSNINNVHVYGNGGYAMYEGIDGKAIDDLQQVPSSVLNGKLCFYAKGPVKMTFTSMRYTRGINPYSTHGYYFLHEGGEDMPVPNVEPGNRPEGEINVRNTSLDYFYHEKEMFSFGSSGKDLLGEDITTGGSFDFTLPQNAGNEIAITIGAASKMLSGTATLAPVIDMAGKQVTTTMSNANVIYSSGAYYSQCVASGIYSLTDIADSGKLNVSFATGSSVISVSKLDYFILTYTRNNVITEGSNSQMRMGYSQISSNDVIALPSATATTQVWRISDAGTPTNYVLTDTEVGRALVTQPTTQATQWVAFDPQGTLMKIDGYEAVENQNLHGLETPTMVIITNKTFMEQAQRIADLHKMVDNMDVLVVDQDQIFNEFSSGTPDAMGYRLMCKMFYDRNRSKFKYLLLFGEGSYDNRGLSSVKANRILTYESDNSTSETNSYTSDDFFGCLEDNASSVPTSCKLSIAVGRFPSASVAEAKSDVDKLVNYVLTPDYGPWRNNAMVSAEFKTEKWSDMHQAQAEGIANILEKSLNTGFAVDKAYVSMFPRAVNETAVVNEEDRSSYEANRHFTEALKRGQYLAAYIGHAGYKSFTGSRLWTSSYVTSVTYPHLPIFTTACCDVARFDSDQRGIAEHMFHMKNGGAIALLTATREVYSDSNHNLHKSWVNQLFNWSPTLGLPRLGDAYKAAKLALAPALNHFKYVLLGDPAMQLAYPLPFFKINTINGIDPEGGSTITVQPMGTVNVSAQVMKVDGSGIDTDFNGDATITIYDKKRFFKNASDIQVKADLTDVYYPEDILTQVQGRVVNGIFNGTAVMPRYSRAVNEPGCLRIYAHRDGTDKMVNGMTRNIIIGEYKATAETTDAVAPTITSMYLNEEQSFQDGAVVPANSTLYIKATDNVAINNQSMSLGNNMRLVLDGGKSSYYLVNNFATVSNGGKDLDVAFPLTGLATGQHTLSYTVHDMAGNATTRSISFIVGNVDNVVLGVEEVPATTSATITAATTTSTTPTVNVIVTDVLGNLVWKTATSSFPLQWNLTDMSGKRVKGGVYKIFGNYNEGNLYGGTNVTQVVVVDPIK